MKATNESVSVDFSMLEMELSNCKLDNYDLIQLSRKMIVFK